jgi:TrmH family RNA methyltransferase
MSLSAARLKSLRALATRKGRAAQGRFLIEGVRAVEEALRRRSPVEALLHDGRIDEPLLRQARARAVPVERITGRELARVCDTVQPQGVAAVVRIEEATLEPVLARRAATVVLLDAVADPGNVGTIIRTAHALGAAAVVLGPGCVEPHNPKVVRAAMGSFLALPVVPCADLGPLIEDLRARGFVVYATAADGERTLDGAGWPERTALLLGSEADGVAPALRARADAALRIPLPGDAESLNVAVAAGILLHEARRR